MKQRSLHPFAWWAWGISMAFTASQSPGVISLLLLCFCAAMVVVSKKGDQPWANAFYIGVRIGLIAFVIRIFIGVVLSVPIPGNTLFSLPNLPLPEWMAGIRVGGPVTSERLVTIATEALTFFTLIIALSAATALANPKQLLRALPGVMHQVGVALILTTTLIPHFVISVKRIQQARRLRGDEKRSSFRKIAMPLFEDSLERALNLGTAMESRGYGFNDSTPGRRYGSQILLGALLALTIGITLFLAAIPGANTALIIGFSLLVIGLFVANKSTRRTRYRPQEWKTPEWLILVAATALILLSFLITSDKLMAVMIFCLTLMPLFIAPKAASKEVREVMM